MIINMNKNFYPINLQEETICTTIKEMNKSSEIKKFVENIKIHLLKTKIEIFNYRIKEQYSALRTYRLANYNLASQMHDLLGFLIVVDNKNDIQEVDKILNDFLVEETISTYNLLEEKDFIPIQYNKIEKHIQDKQYNELIFQDINKWLNVPNHLTNLLPPFSYNILLTKKFKDISNEIPIEIRIQTKEDFITTESYYYTIHKNDIIPLNTKIPLLCMCFRILRRMTNIVFEDNIDIKKKYKIELKEMQDINKDFIKENIQLINNVFKEHNKIVNYWKNRQPIYNFIRMEN